MNWRRFLNAKLIVGIVFFVIGYFSLQYSFEAKCEFGQITAESGGQELDIGLNVPPGIERLSCIITDFSVLLTFLIGVSCIMSGIGGIFKGLTAD